MELDEALADLVERSGDRLLRVAYQLTHDRAALQAVSAVTILPIITRLLR